MKNAVAWKMVAAAVVTAGISLVASSEAAPITTLYNTGVNDSGAPVANGTAATHYTLVSEPTGAATMLRVATSANGYPIPPWIGDDSLSAWIGPSSDAALDGPAGNYDYRTTFSLAGFDPITASIVGRFAADDSGTILLNGIAVTGAQSLGFSSFTSFTISSGFAAGINTLDFIVNNGGGPTGLRTELTGTATASTIPEPASLALLALPLGIAGVLTMRRRRDAGAS